jgi:transglutaminase-like putative cysteine protease
MDLAATFYISVYGLAALSGGILAWAEQNPSVTALTVPVAISALLLNERHRLLRLDDLWSGVVGLAAFVYPVYEFYSGNEESRLLSAAHLLTILQWILLFNKKPAHRYWWICTISCLQIALAAVLTSSPMFGLLILAYMFWALWTLSVFTLLLARLRYGRENRADSSPGGWSWPELDGGDRLPDRQRSRSPQASLVSEFRGSFQCDPHEVDINWRFILGVGGMSASALSLGLIFFLLTPRLWIGAANPFQDTALEGTGRSLSGFSEKVQLGDFGRILESSAPVLELKLVDEQTSTPIAVQAFLGQIGQTEPLLRGTVLGTYQRGEWVPIGRGQLPGFPAKHLPNRMDRPYVHQIIRLEPIGSQTLFSLADPEYGYIDDGMGEIKITHESRSLQLKPTSGPVRGAIIYHLFVPRRTQTYDRPMYQIPPEKQDGPARTDSRRGERGSALFSTRAIERAYLECSREFVTIYELANRLAKSTEPTAGAATPSQLQVAQKIVAYLRDSGEFQYSLDQSRRDPNLDPIEDFIKNRKAGHCQYFATALALMLRAAGIPSRVVTGFKGGVDSPELGVLEVQQRHAHAWVEAHIDGAWVTLDATPASRDDLVDAIGDRVRWYHHIAMFASAVWNDYVVNLSFSKQQRDLYAPLQSLGSSVTNQIRSTSSFWQVLQQNLQTFWEHPEQWFSLRGGLTALMLMLSAVGTFYLLRTLTRLAWRLLLGTPENTHRATFIEFYERFLRLLKPLGLVPKPHQTQLEFAQQVEDAWLLCKLPSEALPLAREISMAFYRLRFGDETLSPDQEARIRDGLVQLEAHLNHS